MKRHTFIRIILVAFFFTSFINFGTSQRSYTFTYEIDLTTPWQPPLHENDTIIVIDPISHKEGSKVIQPKRFSEIPPRPLFAKDQDAMVFGDSLISGLESGAIKGYNNIDDKNALSPSEITHRFLEVDTSITLNPVTLKEETKIVSGMRHISRIVFYEEWSMDSTGGITKKIKGYSLLIDNYDLARNMPGYSNIVTIRTEAK